MRQSQAALAVFVRDLLVTNVARAANLTLLRRDAVLATRPALDQRKRDRVRLSAFLPDKLFGPQADEALEEQARNPTTVLKEAFQSFRNPRRGGYSRPVGNRKSAPPNSDSSGRGGKSKRGKFTSRYSRGRRTQSSLPSPAANAVATSSQ